MISIRWLALLATPLLIAAAPDIPDDRRAAPTASPGSWFTDADYPMDMARQEIDGTTAFRLTIDKLGVPTGCTVTSSSGSAKLDTVTCEKLMLRARFKPARDAKGKPIADVYNEQVIWRLPESDEPMTLPQLPHSLVTTFTINTDGSISDCTSMLNGKIADQQDICAQMAGSRYQVQKDAAGQPIRQKIRMTIGFEKVTDKP